MRTRGIAAGLIGIVLAVFLLRLAIVRANPESNWARRVWPEHPSVVSATAMREIGIAAASGAVPSALTLQRLQELQREAPLSADAFLVEGALADKQGASGRAERLFLEALRRQPRSVAAHYLLADLYLRSGRTSDGMREMAELARLMPATSVQLVPALAQFARSPGAAEQLRQIFRSNPDLEQPLLDALAADPANANLILSVANRTGADSNGQSPEWEEKLLDSMIAQANYRGAYTIWSHIVGIGNRDAASLFNPAFRRIGAPPPFNWSFNSTSAGVAEPENGSLRILFYGHDNSTLARQLLLLPAGRYRLTVPVTVSASTSGALVWSLVCLPSKARIFNLPLPGNAGSQTLAGDFEIPAQACDAQQIELDGALEDSPETTDLRIGPLGLQRIGS